MAKVTKKAIREEKMNELAKLFGAKTGEKVGVPCRGSYRGTTDYFVKFNNGNKFFITSKMKRFDERLDKLISLYRNFTTHKNEFIKILKEREEKDNTIAEEKGLTPYKIIDVNYVKEENDSMGWFYIKMDINKTIKYFTETGFNYSMDNTEKLENEMNRKPNYYVAGGLSDKDVDFVFNNVGFSSTIKMYEIF